MITDTRVEKHVIKKSNKYYSMLDRYCYLSKNLYNHANYLVRERFSTDNKWLRYEELDKLLKADTTFPDYKVMPLAQCSQQTLRVLDKNWKAFFKSIKDWSKNKSKYLGRPRPPKYLSKNGRFEVILTNQACKIKDGVVKFPKSFDGFEVKPYFLSRNDFVKFNQVRIIPKQNQIVVELVYEIECCEQLPDNNRYLGIDIGVDNLATCALSDGSFGFAINGRPLKSINQFYNKRKAEIQSELAKTSSEKYSIRLARLSSKRNSKVDDYLHKVSKKIVDYCVANSINTIIVGKNKGWKQNVNIGKRNIRTSFRFRLLVSSK